MITKEESLAHSVLIWNAAENLYEKMRKLIDDRIQYSPVSIGQRAVIEFNIRTVRMATAVKATADALLAQEAMGMMRLPTELHLNQLAIAYVTLTDEKVEEGDRPLTMDEKGRKFFDFGDFERLSFLREFPDAPLGPFSGEKRVTKKAELEIAVPKLPWTFKGHDWHGLRAKALIELVGRDVPNHIQDHGFGKLLDKLPYIYRYQSKILHASPIPHSTFYETEVVGNEEKSFSPMGASMTRKMCQCQR